MNFSVWYILSVALWFARVEREIVLTPDYQQARLLLAHPGLPFRVSVDIGSIAVEEVALNLGLAGLIEKVEFICPEIRVIAFDVGVQQGNVRKRIVLRFCGSCTLPCLRNITSSEQPGTLPCRLACARRPRPLFRADRFQSWDARRSVRRSAVYPRNPLVFPRPSLECLDCH
jgi:hypothetical protein